MLLLAVLLLGVLLRPQLLLVALVAPLLLLLAGSQASLALLPRVLLVPSAGPGWKRGSGMTAKHVQKKKKGRPCAQSSVTNASC